MADNKLAERRSWTEQEDKALKTLYESLKLNRWSLIAQQLEVEYGFSGRTGKQCRQRYNNQLDPGLNRQNWTFDQEKRLYSLHDQLGNKWAIISQRLGPGRTDNSVKNHFFSRLRKSLRKLNKVIQDKYKKEIREIQIKVLYKIIEASQQKFKPEPMCEAQTSQKATLLKNKILMFSYEEEEVQEYKDSAKVRDLIEEVISFNKYYKRKPKKFRKLGAPNLDMLDNIDPAEIVQRKIHQDIAQNPSNNFLATSRKSLEDQEDQLDQINHGVHTIQTQTQKFISPIILTGHAKLIEQKIEKQEKCYKGSQLLEQLGLLEDDAGDHIFLRRKQTSQLSNTGQQSHQEFKFFEDSENEMKLCAPLFNGFKKQSFEQRLFH